MRAIGARTIAMNETAINLVRAFVPFIFPSSIDVETMIAHPELMAIRVRYANARKPQLEGFVTVYISVTYMRSSCTLGYSDISAPI